MSSKVMAVNLCSINIIFFAIKSRETLVFHAMFLLCILYLYYIVYENFWQFILLIEAILYDIKWLD